MKNIKNIFKEIFGTLKFPRSSQKMKDELASKEIIIENNILHIKRSFKKIHMSSDVRPENNFILNNGNSLKNLEQLHDELKKMPPEVFNAHVNNYKNDFASWVNDCIGLPDLAQNMRISQTKEQISDLIEKWHYS